MGRALLKLKSKDASNQEDFVLSKDVTTIGRSRSADITLQDTSVSRIHVRIELRNDQFYVIDNNSSNGTFINRRKVSQSPLRNGDVLIVGRVYFDFKEESDSDEGGRTAALPTLDAEGKPLGLGGTMSVKVDSLPGPAAGVYVEPEPESILELDDDEDSSTNQQDVVEDEDALDDTWRPPEVPSTPTGQAPPPPPPPPPQVKTPPPPSKPKSKEPRVEPKAILNHKRDRADAKLRVLSALIDVGVAFVLGLPAIIAGLLGIDDIPSLLALLAQLMILVHLIGGWWFYGKTIGKAILGLRIVDLQAADKEGLTPETLIKRILGYIACAIPFGLGFFFILKDPQGRGLHDQFANTIVIKED